MLIEEMTREASIALLTTLRLGRIACSRGLQPYVTPFFFAYRTGFLYSLGTVGKKIEWMRSNPLVCVEADIISSHSEWQTIVVSGCYEELPNTPEFYDRQMLAHDLLAHAANWWEPGFAKTLHDRTERALEPVYFRITVSEISGHRGTRDAAG